MALARLWRRRVYASFGLAVVAPLALLVTLGLLAAGGFPSLGALRQAFSGPSLSAANAPRLGTVAAGPRAGALLASTGVSGGAVLGGGGPSASAGPTAPGSGSPRSVSGGTGGSHGGTPSSGGPPPSSHHRGSSQHQHRGSPTVVDRAVGKVTPVTSKLPPPAGPLATGTLKSVAAQADKIIKRLPGL